MFMKGICFAVPALAACSFLAISPAGAMGKKKEVIIPHCVRPLGTAAVRLPPAAQNWWGDQHLSSPDTVVKAIVMKSGCFTLVDRGMAMQLADEERARAASGNLQADSNIGKGQVRAADFIIVPTLLSKNDHAGGSGVGGIIGGLFSGVTGGLSSLLGGLNLHKKTADVHLEVVDVRSGVVTAAADGHAKKKNLSWGGGGAAVIGYGFGGMGVTGYTDTEIGQVIMAAYIDSFDNLISSLGAVRASDPSEIAQETASTGTAGVPAAVPAAATASLTAFRPGTLRDGPSLSGKLLRSFPAGAVFFPAGETVNKWLKVTDEVGTEGWVSSLSVKQ